MILSELIPCKVGDGFTERFYTTTYCWEQMKHVPVVDMNDTSGNTMQVRDVTKDENIKDLTYLKVSPTWT